MPHTPPPGPHEIAPFPASALWLARAYLAVAVVALTVGGAAAIIMRLELWSAGLQADAEQYARALSVHRDMMLYGVLAVGVVVGLGHLQVGDVTPARRAPTAWLAALAILLWIGGVALLEVPMSMARFGDVAVFGVDAATATSAARAVIVGLALIAAALLLNAVHFAVAIGRGMRGASTLVRATSAVLLLSILWQCGALARASIELAELIDEPLPGVLVPDLGPSMASAIVGSIALAVHAASRSVTATPRSRVPVPVLYIAGLYPTFWLGVHATVALFTLSADSHIHDTYFVVGVTHLFVSIVVLVLFLGQHAWCDVLLRRRPHDGLAKVGCVLSCAGMLGTSVAMLHLGVRGMPRRYVDYLPMFEVSHRAITCAALVTVLGALFVAASIVAGRSPREPA